MSLSSLIRFTLSRRVTVFVLAVMVLVVGVIATRRLPLELLPRGFQENDISVVIPVEAANPIEVQESIVRPTEELLRTIPGIKRLVSSAGVNEAWLNIEFSKDVDLDLAAAEVRDRLERARIAWPPEVRRYRIFRFNLDTDLPVFRFGIAIDKPSDEITFLVEEKILKPLEAVPGVARVRCRGLLDDQVRIFIDRERALSASVDLYQLTQALQAGNLDVSGGEIEDGGVRYTLKSEGRFRSIEDLREFPIRPGLRLGQIATIEPTKTVRDFVALTRTKPTLWCIVQKESSANTVETCARVREVLRERIMADPRLKELGVSFEFFEWGDVGHVVTSALANLAQTALDGGWLSILVLLFFLRRVRLTALIGLAIPMSLLITGIWIAATGASLNLLAMVGVTVAIGMLVDNAIVVVESIQQKRETGLTPLEAAMRGTSEIALPVVLSTLTTVMAFIPVMFMGGEGNLSFFLSGIGVPLCYAVLASLVVALLFVPLGTVVAYAGRASRPDRPFIAKLRRSRLVDGMVAIYARTLAFALRRRFATIALFTVLVGGATALASKKVPLTSVTGDQGGRVSISIDLASNFTLRDAHAAFLELGGALERIGPNIGLKNFWCFFDRAGGDIEVLLEDKNPARTKEIAKTLKESLPKPAGVKLQCSVDGDREEEGKITFSVYGDDVVRLADVAQDVAQIIEAVPGVLRVRNDLRTASGEVHVVPDREKLRRLGIVPESLTGTIQYGIRGFPLNDLVSGEREIPLIIQFAGGDEQTLGELRETTLFTSRGSQVPMSAVADVGVARGLSEIRREGGRARARLTVEADEKDAEDIENRIKNRLGAHLLPEGFSYQDHRGADLQTAQKQMAFALLLSATFVFLLMGVMFESTMLPFAVFVTVPFAWAGAIIALAVLNTTFDFIGMISLVVLVGVVVNNGIILIECAARLRAEGRERTDALLLAGRLRLRPILMTALTTILGLLPTAVATSTGSQISYQSLAIAISGGLTLATLVTLYLTPITYSLLDDLRVRFTRDARALAPAGKP
jgi:hydrophobic/amphiphilic exporter-1 (mainly G- bacteria), HAE1 family